MISPFCLHDSLLTADQGPLCAQPALPLNPAVIKPQVLSLEEQRRLLEAELCQKSEDLQAASAQKAELAKQLQSLTKSMEEQYALAVRTSEQKLRRLQVSLQRHPTTSALWLLMLVFP